MRSFQIYAAACCVALLTSTAVFAQTSQTTYARQGDLTRCAANATPSALSTVACPGLTPQTTANRLNLSYTRPNGTSYTACYYINNNDPQNKTYFVPLKTYREWEAFMNAAPSRSMQLVACPSAVSSTNGSCGSANNSDVTTAPTTNLCGAGTASTVASSSGQFIWTCAGSNGGTTANCATAQQCSPAGSMYVWNGLNWDDYGGPNWGPGGLIGAVPPPGTTADAYLGQGVYMSNAGTILSCGNSPPANPSVVNGACGSAANTATMIPPTANLCSTGTASPVVLNADGTSWTWNCNGSGGGSSTTCTQPSAAGAGGWCILKSGTRVMWPMEVYQEYDVFVSETSTPGCTSMQFWSTDVPDGRYRCTSNYSIIAVDCGRI